MLIKDETKGGLTAVAEKQLMERCIAERLDCVKVAARCATSCIQSEQSPKLAECIRLCWDCVDISTACASLMARESRFGGQVCGPCADICEAAPGVRAAMNKKCRRFDGSPLS